MEDLAKKIELVIKDELELKRMGKKAYEHVKNDFQFDKYYDSVKKVMERYRQRGKNF